MINEHERIKKLAVLKTRELEKQNKKIGEENVKIRINRIKKVIELLSNNRCLFQKIDINIALSILKDIGIEEDDLINSYKKLLKEEIGTKYTLIDINLNKEEER